MGPSRPPSPCGGRCTPKLESHCPGGRKAPDRRGLGPRLLGGGAGEGRATQESAVRSTRVGAGARNEPVLC